VLCGLAVQRIRVAAPRERHRTARETRRHPGRDLHATVEDVRSPGSGGARDKKKRTPRAWPATSSHRRTDGVRCHAHELEEEYAMLQGDKIADIKP
jgi:hypothetical protein